EVPIHFADRKHGSSKLSLREQLKYLQHIKRLADYRFGDFSFAFQFLIVGVTGTLVNLAVITALHSAGVSAMLSIVWGIFISMTTNFFFNRHFTFTYARDHHVVLQYFRYAAASSIGIAVNCLVAIQVLSLAPLFKIYPQIPALAGVVAGVVFNFAAARFWVF